MACKLPGSDSPATGLPRRETASHSLRSAAREVTGEGALVTRNKLLHGSCVTSSFSRMEPVEKLPCLRWGLDLSLSSETSPK